MYLYIYTHKLGIVLFYRDIVRVGAISGNYKQIPAQTEQQVLFTLQSIRGPPVARAGKKVKAHTHTQIHTNVHTRTHTCTHIHIHTHTHTHSVTCVSPPPVHKQLSYCSHARKHTNARARARTHTHTYTYTYTHVHIHIHVHIHKHTLSKMSSLPLVHTCPPCSTRV